MEDRAKMYMRRKVKSKCHFIDLTRDHIWAETLLIQFAVGFGGNYAVKAKEEIDKLLRFGFIQPVKQATWLSLIMVVPKKNRKIRVCVDYLKLNATIITNAFPLPFTDGVLDAVAKHEVCSFLDGFSCYNKIRMHPDDQEKTMFVTERESLSS